MNPILRLLPDLILSVGGTAILIIQALRNTPEIRDLLRSLAIIFVAAAAVALQYSYVPHQPYVAEQWLSLTPLSVLFGLVFLGIIAWVILAGPLPQHDSGEWYAVLLFAGTGMLVLAENANIAAFFLGLELLSLSLYVLIAFSYRHRVSLRAGVVYLVLAGFASAFLVFGLAMIYAAYGTFEIHQLRTSVTSSPQMPVVAMIGFGVFLVGVFFKLAVVPFHMWAPNVYEGAPGAISGLIASASKGAMIAAMVPFLFLTRSHWQILWLLAAASMLGGNILGLMEMRVKRILAYSSIGHIGYVLLGYLANGPDVPTAPLVKAGGAQVIGIGSVYYYIIAYAIAILGAFVSLAALERDYALTLRDLRGVGRKQPAIALCLLVFIISLAGLPPTVGFWGKLYLFTAGVKAGYIWLSVLGLIGSAIGLFYYLRILKYLFMMPPDTTNVKTVHGPLQAGMLVLTAVATVLLGFFPDTLFATFGLY